MDHNLDKYITTSEFDKLTTENFKARLAQANLVKNIYFSNRLQSYNKNIVSNRQLIKINQSKLNLIQKNYFKGKTYLKSDDGTQNHLVFQPLSKHFQKNIGVGNGQYVYYWKSKGLSDESINSITTSAYIITPNYFGNKVRVKFSGSCLKQDKIGYTHKTIVNIYIFHEITKNNPISSYPTL